MNESTKARGTPGWWLRWAAPRRVLLGLTALLALGVVAAGAVSALAARDLVEARDAALHGRDTLAAGEVQAAAAAFERSANHFADAQRRVGHPLLGAAGVLPLVGDNVGAARIVAAAGGATARAGRRVAGALAGLPEGLDSLAPSEGRIPVQRIADLHAPVAAAADDLHEGAEATAAQPTGGLLAPVADAIDQLDAQLPALRDAAETAAALTAHLPDFLGADRPRRYFFAATNPAELRGTGGLPGAYAILTADDGRLSFTDFGPVQQLPDVPVEEVEAPTDDYAARYDRYGGAGFWLNINMTPDFPSAARAIQGLYERVTGASVDGVIAADPHALAALAGTAGSVDIPGAGRVDADEVVSVVANEAFGDFDDSAQRKQALGAAAAAVFTRFLDGGAGDLQGAVRSLAAAADGGHLLVYASDSAIQAAFERAGVAGGIAEPDGDYLSVVGNNAAANKVDFYMHRRVRYDVELQTDGSVDGQATVTLTNEAPTSGQPRYVIGPNAVEGIKAGENSTILAVYCAPDCQLDSFHRDGTEQPVGTEREFGRPVFTSNERLESGETTELSYRWTVPEVWQGGNAGTYRLVFDEQPQIHPTELEIRFTVPDGAEVVDASAGFEQRERTLVWTGQPSAREIYEVQLAPAIDAPSLAERLQRPLLLGW